MATEKTLHFAPDGTELAYVFGLPNARFKELFPGVKGRTYDSFKKWIGYAPGVPYRHDGTGSLPVARVIYYKTNPSLHKCDGRCLNAKGHNCECSCGGKNHGVGG